jgi:hypothetical protein
MSASAKSEICCNVEAHLGKMTHQRAIIASVPPASHHPTHGGEMIEAKIRLMRVEAMILLLGSFFFN